MHALVSLSSKGISGIVLPSGVRALLILPYAIFPSGEMLMLLIQSKKLSDVTSS